MIVYLKEYQIIPDNHHGGRPGFLNVSAKVHPDSLTAEMMEDRTIVSTMTTDLTSAFNLINHAILIKKLKVLGFKEKACNPMKSFFHNRKQYFKLQDLRSTMLHVGDLVSCRAQKRVEYYRHYTTKS